MIKFPLLRKAYVFDVDGTLANNNHRQHYLNEKPKNWGGFFGDQYRDTPHHDILMLLDLMADADKCILIATGRGEEHREVTARWLISNDIPYSRIYMRPLNDRRDDSVIKTEMIPLMRADGYEPVMAFDDRDRVVAAWRAAGIRCLQVAPGDF